jgi:hypothetical protein
LEDGGGAWFDHKQYHLNHFVGAAVAALIKENG